MGPTRKRGNACEESRKRRSVAAKPRCCMENWRRGAIHATEMDHDTLSAELDLMGNRDEWEHWKRKKPV